MQPLDTSQFHPISLEQMDGVKLMDRTDTKFCSSMEELNELLKMIEPFYYILTIDGSNQFMYSTTYFDTPEAKMYANHLRGKMNRYKIRRRTYISSGIHFMEIKFKSNKGRTIKERIPTLETNGHLSYAEQHFIETNTPFKPLDLKPGLTNYFNRITLVNKNFNERCTIDFELKFSHQGDSVALHDMAIIELKTGNRNTQSQLLNAIRTLRIKPSGFSKYCIGRSLTDQKLKTNAIRPKLRQLQKISGISILTLQLSTI